MKVTLNWLRRYVDFEWSPEELAERLTMLGIEVEGIQKLTGEFEGVVVAEVLSRDKHPNADKLSLCRVNDGKGERQIVCGAHNFQAGDKVPLIIPGATLPARPGEQPLTIKVGKIRGVESQGMLCSPRELGMSDDAEGLLILPKAARVGQPFAEHLGRATGDVVYDLEVTPNRPDLNSVIGIAREVAAVTGNPLRSPDTGVGGASAHHNPSETAEPVPNAAGLVAVRIDDPDLCPRYVARIIKGVKVGPSPDWLRLAVERVGLRSISNVVDVTNYVMFECGQPLHTFDYHLIAKGVDGMPTIVIRRASEGDRFATLDGQARTLTKDMLLVADETKGIALAGVMGGQNSEINAQTVDVLIESAYFNPTNIRRTSKALGLRTDASYRFERGADLGITDWASRRCAQLILQTAGGVLAEGAVDAFPSPRPSMEIILRHARTDALLGIEIPDERQNELLRRLGLELLVRPALVPRSTTFQIPTWRVDIKGEIDLIEEIARLYGVDKIPVTPPRGAVGSNAFDAVHDELADVRRVLSGLGLDEAQGQTLISDATAKLAASAESVVMLANPLSSDMNSLRPSLLPGLLDSLRHNLHRKNEDVALFELGRVFVAVNGKSNEQRRLAIALTGRRAVAFWSGSEREAKFDLSDAKGVLEEFFEQFGARAISFVRHAEPTDLFLESATMAIGGKMPVGELGLLLPSLARRYDLRDAVLLAELNLDLLLARRNRSKQFKPLPQFPSVRRDVAMIVPETVTHDAVLGVVRQAKAANLESVALFDVFRGKNVPDGQKSVAYAFTYRGVERTLTDQEVNSAHDKLVAQFKQALQATVRE